MVEAIEHPSGRGWVRGGDCWIVPLQGQTVTQLRFDQAVGLVFDEGLEVRVEQSFTLRAGDVEHRFDPENDPRSLAPVLGLGRSTATGGLAFDDGRLKLEFLAGSRLVVEPDSEFEAWQITGPGGLLVVAGPGGGLATWGLSAAS